LGALPVNKLSNGKYLAAKEGRWGGLVIAVNNCDEYKVHVFHCFLPNDAQTKV
jgi:hypothetical protein